MAEYRVDDLARAAGMTVRNVRAYQERGLLHPPRRRGRTGWYDDTHVARLRLIGRLHERGYTSAHIAEFIANWEAGHDLGQTLGLEAALLAPASGEIPEHLAMSDLVAMFGGVFDPGAFAAAERLGIIAPLGDDRYEVGSPRLLRAGAELFALGMSLPDILDLAKELRLRVAAVSTLFVSKVAGLIVGSRPAGWVPSDAEMAQITEVVERLRPLARVVVDEELAATLERGISDYVASWLGATMPALDQPDTAS